MLSVTLITLNEENDLARCLESVKEIADEVIVVDSGSTDKTVEIARKFGAKVFERKFDNYANQKNFAVEKSSGEWIFSIDADEEASPELCGELKEVIKEGNFSGFSVPRKNIILGKFIKYTRWDPDLDRHIWLWRKDKGRWVGDVHEEVEVEGAVGRLKNAKVHHQYETISEFFGMMNRYSELEAKQKLKEGMNFSLFRFFWDPLYMFLVRFFYRKGFLDGWRGFVLSYLMAIYDLNVWIKIWQKHK
jgi:glycosyltransferase involved in cell wall biosynthesis